MTKNDSDRRLAEALIIFVVKLFKVVTIQDYLPCNQQ